MKSDRYYYIPVFFLIVYLEDIKFSHLRRTVVNNLTQLLSDYTSLHSTRVISDTPRNDVALSSKLSLFYLFLRSVVPIKPDYPIFFFRHTT